MLDEHDPPPDEQGVVLLVVPQGSAAFDALAQVEVRVFPESAADLALNADASEYLIVASSTQGHITLHHVVRVCHCCPAFGPSGLWFLEDISRSQQGVTAAELGSVLTADGIDLTRTFSVECNFGIGPRLSRDLGAPYSALAYAGLFGRVDGADAVLAWVNAQARRSLSRLGFAVRPLWPTDLGAPETVGDMSIVDHSYRPISLYRRENAGALQRLAEFKMPTVLVAPAIGR